MDIVGKIFKSNNCGDFEVIEFLGWDKFKKNRVYKIKFIQTEYVSIVRKVCINKGNVKDRLYPSVFGIGYLGDIDTSLYKQEYSLWTDMLRRCYDKNSPNYNRYGNKGIYVDSSWHCFKTFVEDISKLDNYNLWKNKSELKYEFDKDIKQQQLNKVYSVETCSFVTREENLKHRNVSNIGKKKMIKVIFPNGKVEIVNGINRFARENDIPRNAIFDCLKRKRNNYNNWFFEYII